ncbi:hypothetical protein JCM8547_006633 [Rhodosporidiobolus lusitaniae]
MTLFSPSQCFLARHLVAKYTLRYVPPLKIPIPQCRSLLPWLLPQAAVRHVYGYALRHVNLREGRTAAVKGKGVRIVAGEAYPVRQNSRPSGFIEFSELRLPFDVWNKQYEECVSGWYGQDAQPWYSGLSESTAAGYKTTYWLKVIEQVRTLIRRNIHSKRYILDEYGDSTVFTIFRFMGQAEREKLVLQAFRFGVDATEKWGTTLARDDAPELSIAFFPKDNNFERLVRALFPPPGSQDAYRVVTSPGGIWERLQDPTWSSFSSRPVLLSSNMQAWVKSGYMARHQALTTLCDRLLFLNVGVPPEELKSERLLRHPAVEDDEKDFVGHVKDQTGRTRMCSACGYAEEGKVFKYRSKCKNEGGREVLYCSAVKNDTGPSTSSSAGAQPPRLSTSLPARPNGTGYPLSRQLSSTLSSSSPVSSSAFTTPVQAAALQRLDASYVEARVFKQKWELPLFVRPYRPTLAKLVEIRDHAFKSRDRVLVGIVSSFVRPGNRYAAGQAVPEQEQRRLLCAAFDLEPVDLANATDLAEEAVAGQDEFALVRSCFEQLTSSFAGATMLKTSLHAFDWLVRSTEVFWAYYPPFDDLAARGAKPLYIPSYLTPLDAVSSVIRGLGYRAVESAGKDEFAVGVVRLFTDACLEADEEVPHRPGEPTEFFDCIMAVEMGVDMETIALMRVRAGFGLEDRAAEGDEECKLLLSALQQMYAKAATFASYEERQRQFNALYEGKPRLTNEEANALFNLPAQELTTKQRQNRRKTERKKAKEKKRAWAAAEEASSKPAGDDEDDLAERLGYLTVVDELD